MGRPVLRITGVRGFLTGEERTLQIGEQIVIGRSRDADLSVRKAARFLAREDRAALIRSEPVLSVSRRHVRIHFLHGDLVEVVDLSRNGTYLDGRRIECVGLTDLSRTSHLLDLGPAERLKLELVADEPE